MDLCTCRRNRHIACLLQNFNNGQETIPLTEVLLPYTA